MEIKNYDGLIKIISEKLATEFLSNEEGIGRRALLIDADISEITRKIGSETAKIIYQETLSEYIRKKKPKD